MSSKWQVLVLPFVSCCTAAVRARRLTPWLREFASIENRNLQTSLLIVANRPDLGSVNKIFSSRFDTLLWLYDIALKALFIITRAELSICSGYYLITKVLRREVNSNKL